MCNLCPEQTLKEQSKFDQYDNRQTSNVIFFCCTFGQYQQIELLEGLYNNQVALFRFCLFLKLVKGIRNLV